MQYPAWPESMLSSHGADGLIVFIFFQAANEDQFHAMSEMQAGHEMDFEKNSGGFSFF